MITNELESNFHYLQQWKGYSPFPREVPSSKFSKAASLQAIIFRLDRSQSWEYKFVKFLGKQSCDDFFALFYVFSILLNAFNENFSHHMVLTLKSSNDLDSLGKKVFNQLPTKVCDTNSFYCGDPHTNQDSCMARPKNAWSCQHSNFWGPSGSK